MDNNKILPKALYRGKLPIGGVNLDCAVLDSGKIILTLTSVFTTSMLLNPV